MCGLLVVPVLVAGGFYLSGSVRPAATRAPGSRASGSAPTAVACGSAAAGPCAVSSPIHIAVAQVPPTAHSWPARPRRPRPSHFASPPVSASARPSPSASASAQPSSPETAADQVLALINEARALENLPALTFSDGLNASAAAHDAMMAAGCGLSHQCPGEPPLGDREAASGVRWTSAGENIGEGGPVAHTLAAIAQMAVTLTQDMLNERPPDDGHRLNILSTTFTHIGIAVWIDSDHDVWMTQDFSS